jgi:hypothetical protein
MWSLRSTVTVVSNEQTHLTISLNIFHEGAVFMVDNTDGWKAKIQLSPTESLIGPKYATSSRLLRTSRQIRGYHGYHIISKLVSDVHILDRFMVCLAGQTSRDGFIPQKKHARRQAESRGVIASYRKNIKTPNQTSLAYRAPLLMESRVGESGRRSPCDQSQLSEVLNCQFSARVVSTVDHGLQVDHIPSLRFLAVSSRRMMWR